MLFNERIHLDRCAEFFGVGPDIDKSVWQSFRLTLQNLVNGSFWMGIIFASSHQSCIYDDAGKPRGKRRPSLKGPQVGVCLAQAVQDRRYVGRACRRNGGVRDYQHRGQ